MTLRHGSSTLRWLAAAIVGMMLLMTVPPVSPASSGTVEWWGPTDIGQGHHIRVPVTVTNPHDVARTAAPVAVELDVSSLLAEAGWTSTQRGDRTVLDAFDLDMDSIRVVSMTDLQPQQPGTIHGRLSAHDTSFSSSDPTRYLVPSTAFESRILSEQDQPFNSRTNPTITVLWRVGETLQPGETAHYVIYLDTKTNRDHSPRTYDDIQGGAALDNLFWFGTGTTLVGTTTDRGVTWDSQESLVKVLGLHPDTTVHVQISDGTGPFRSWDPDAMGNPFEVDSEEVRTLPFGRDKASTFKLIADRPIRASVASEGFVPSVDRDVAGEEFYFHMTKPEFYEQNTVTFIATPDNTEPTTVRVESVTGGFQAEYELQTNDNPHPFSRSGRDRFSGPNGRCRAQGPGPLLPSGPGFYHAEVVSGGPVLLQLQPAGGMFQPPTVDGASVGHRSLSVVSWADREYSNPPRGNPSCGPAGGVGDWIAGTFEDSTTVEVRDLRADAVTTVDPEVGVVPTGFTGPNSEGSDNYPLEFSGARPFHLFTGMSPPFGSDPVRPGAAQEDRPSRAGGVVLPRIHGPLGGDRTGQAFAGIGPTMIYAPFHRTVVEAELDYLESGVVEETVQMSAGSLHRFEDRSSRDRLSGVKLEANRPIIAYPLLENPTTLSAIPSFLEPTVHDAEFRGHLVEIATASGDEPAIGSTFPGEPTTYTLDVSNLGRTAEGGGLRDTVELSTRVPDGWSAELDTESLSLQGGETRPVHLTVTPDGDRSPGDVGTVVVTAESQGNPKMSSTVTTVTQVESRFDVGLWFDLVNGPKQKTRITDQGNATVYGLVVKNEGSVEDTIRLEATAPEEGWDVTLIDDQGRSVSTLSLDPLETADLTLRVTPPAGLTDGVLLTSVTASSETSESTVDRVTATTKIRALSDLALDVPVHTRHVRPGEEALFPLELTNTGEGTAEVSLDAETSVGSGWTGPAVFHEALGTGDRVNLTEISIGPGETVPLGLSVTPPLNATANERASVRFSARLSDGGSLQALLDAFVEPVHRLQVTRPSLPLDADGGQETIPVPLTVDNDGNLDERLSPRVRSIPAGWSLSTPSALTVPRNGSQSATFEMSIPPTTEAGQYEVALELVSEDGNATEVELPVDVGTMADIAIDAVDQVQAQPGERLRSPVSVRNMGNVPVLLKTGPAEDEAWPLLGPGEPVRLEPGDRRPVPIAWEVPQDVADGVSTHRARLQIDPEAPGLPPSDRAVEIPVDVGRPDLRLSAAESVPAAAGTAHQVSVVNDGDRPARDVSVQLATSDEVVDRVRIDVVPPGQTANASLLKPSDVDGDLQVEVDPADRIAELDEDNNAASVDSLAAGETTPSAGFVVVVGALSVAAIWAMRRRRE